MSTIIHLADLHVNTESLSYCSAVLSEITSQAVQLKADFLFFGGDTFDSEDDFYSHWNWFCSALSSLPADCRVVLISGNHDLTGTNASKMISIPDRWHLIKGEDKVLSFTDFDLICLPHKQAGPGSFRFSMASKQKPRILLAHGIPEGHSLAAVDQSAMILPASDIAHCNADLGLLGHIHKPGEFFCKETRMIYPGSARIWRKGEAGPRSFLLLRLINNQFTSDSRIIQAAGQFLEQPVILIPGEKPYLAPLSETVVAQDWLHFTFSGVIREEQDLQPLQVTLDRWWSRKVRHVTFDPSALVVLNHRAHSPVISRYLRKWKELRPDLTGSEEDLVLWREGGIAGLKAIMEAHT